MDRTAPATPSRRDIMFCHQCENEWYRDEHGFECPDCHSEFCEVIEENNDPRESLQIPQANEDAPDPDEDDIDRYDDDGAFRPAGFRARFERTRSHDSTGEQQSQQQGGGGLLGFLGNAFRLASDLVQPPPGHQNEQEEGTEQSQNPATRSTTQRAVTPDGTTVTRHVHGNGYSFTMTTSTRSANTIQPRDPHNPQPFNRQPNDIDNMMQQILGNIGVFPPGHPGFDRFVLNPEMGGMNRGGAPQPFPGGLFQMLGLPIGGVHGDAVYSQEGLDRIVTQLMEQHQSGNAPGPATRNAIDSLPQRSITEKDLGESGSAECSICMESVALDDKVTVLPCEHWFHHDCIGAWLAEHDTCPHCREGIMPRHQRDGHSARRPSQAPLNDMRAARRARRSVPGAFPQYGTSSGHERPSEQAGQVHDRLREAFGGANSSSSNDDHA